MGNGRAEINAVTLHARLQNVALYFTTSVSPAQNGTSGISWYHTLNSSDLITTDGLKASETLGQLAD